MVLCTTARNCRWGQYWEKIKLLVWLLIISILSTLILILVVSKIAIRIDRYRYFKNIDPFFYIFKISIHIEKFWREVGNTLYKFLDIKKGNFVTFLRQFLEKLVKNYPKNMKLFRENSEIIWRNYKIIILGTFWKFLGKHVRQVSFVKQILNYLLKTLKKCWKFVEKFWGILDWLCSSILNIFMKSCKNVQKIVEKITE